MSRIDTLLFDFGGTLDCPGCHWLDRFLVHYQAVGIGLTRAQLDPAFAHATRLGYRAGAPIYRYGLRRLVKTLLSWQADYLIEGMPALEGDGFGESSGLRDLIATIADRFCAESIAGLAQSRVALARLATRFRIGVVSNFYGNLETILDEARILPLVSMVADSSRVGFFKPDPQIFIYALARLSAAPDRAVMIGDSLGKDCAPARGLGLKTIWLAAPGAHAEGGQMSADYVVNDLREVVETCVGLA